MGAVILESKWNAVLFSVISINIKSISVIHGLKGVAHLRLMRGVVTGTSPPCLLLLLQVSEVVLISSA